MNYTPGPWTWHATPPGRYTINAVVGDFPGAPEMVLAEVFEDVEPAEDVIVPDGEPNARLIAASPTLLASCKELREALAGAMRVMVTRDGLTELFIAEMTRIGIADGIGVRVESAIAQAESRL